MNGVVVWEEFKMFFQVLTSSSQPQILSIHVVVRTRTAKKCTKMQNAHAECAEVLFLLIKFIVLWRSCGCHRCPCMSSLMC